MTRTFRLGILVAILFAATLPARASSTPAIAGVVSGIELCPQYICGVAIFAGAFQGKVGGRSSLGFIAVAVHHQDPLPAPGTCKLITDGQWSLQVGQRSFGGGTQGLLCANADNTFNVLVNMSLAKGANGSLTFGGLLDHNVFPPTIVGAIQ